MKYIDACKIIKEIDSKYDVMSIRYKGIPMWPYIRIFLQDSISLDKHEKGSVSDVVFVLKSLLKDKPYKVLKKHKIWVDTGMNTLNKIGDKYYHRITGAIPFIEPNTIVISNLSKGYEKIRNNEIDAHDVVNGSWLFLITRIIEFVSRFRKTKLEGENVLQSILGDYNLSFDYRFFVRYFWARKTALDVVFCFVKPPQVVFITDPYDKMGFVLSYHQHNVAVVELQHGVLNEDHEGYNLNYKCDILRPDEICVYGEREKALFTNKLKHYAKHVTETGLYIFDKIDEYYSNDVFEKYRKHYSKIIVVSGQVEMEDVLSNFVEQVAIDMPDVLFLYIPRMKDRQLSFSRNNVILCPGVNMYVYLKWCDIHMTVSSTTTIESQYFQKPSIVFDHEQFGSLYYGSIMNEDNGVFYVNTKEQFVVAYNTIQNGTFTFRDFFVHNHIDRMCGVIKRYIS